MIPTLWFRNTWSWGRDDHKPQISATPGGGGAPSVRAVHHELGTLLARVRRGPPTCSLQRTKRTPHAFGAGVNPSPFVKDGNRPGHRSRSNRAINQTGRGHEIWSCANRVTLAPGATQSDPAEIVARPAGMYPFKGAELSLDNRRAEADEFYATLSRGALTERRSVVERQALAWLDVEQAVSTTSTSPNGSKAIRPVHHRRRAKARPQ